MVEFTVLDDTETNFIKCRLVTFDWIVEFHLSFLDYESGDFELYGDEPVVQYIGFSEDIPIFDLDDDEISDMIEKSKWT